MTSRQDGMPIAKKKLEKVTTKKRELHELPDTELVKPGTTELYMTE